jgi:hypothetical protein
MTSPVSGITLTIAILALSSFTCPPRGFSTIDMIAFVGGAAVPGKIGSSVSVEEAPSEESLQYLYISTYVAAVYS